MVPRYSLQYTGGPDMTMAEVSDASSIIADSADLMPILFLGRLLMKTWVQKLRLA